jgi:hypothetical protein
MLRSPPAAMSVARASPMCVLCSQMMALESDPGTLIDEESSIRDMPG